MVGKAEIEYLLCAASEFDVSVTAGWMRESEQRALVIDFIDAETVQIIDVESLGHGWT